MEFSNTQRLNFLAKFTRNRTSFFSIKVCSVWGIGGQMKKKWFSIKGLEGKSSELGTEDKKKVLRNLSLSQRYRVKLCVDLTAENVERMDVFFFLLWSMFHRRLKESKLYWAVRIRRLLSLKSAKTKLRSKDLWTKPLDPGITFEENRNKNWEEFMKSYLGQLAENHRG